MISKIIKFSDKIFFCIINSLADIHSTEGWYKWYNNGINSGYFIISSIF